MSSQVTPIGGDGRRASHHCSGRVVPYIIPLEPPLEPDGDVPIMEPLDGDVPIMEPEPGVVLDASQPANATASSHTNAIDASAPLRRLLFIGPPFMRLRKHSPSRLSINYEVSLFADCLNPLCGLVAEDRRSRQWRFPTSTITVRASIRTPQGLQPGPPR